MDSRKIWYQYEEAELRRIVDVARRAAVDAGASRIVCLGNSMGGFGALQFGRLLQADAIIAIAPQTCIDPEHTDAMGDHRWRRWQESISTYHFGDLAQLDPGKSKITLVCGADEPLDCAHLDRYPWEAQRVFVEGAGHNVASKLQDKGTLTALIRSAGE